jgi:hypothetical protein
LKPFKLAAETALVTDIATKSAVSDTKYLS